MPKSPTLKLPDDLEQCQQMIRQIHEQMESLQEQLQVLLRARYGRKSETILVGQLRLFGEQPTEPEADDSQPAGEAEQVRKTHGRKKPPKDLPRVRREYNVDESERPCPYCSTVREIIGEEVSEQYDYTPASIRVIEHVRLKRSCKSCGEQVIVADKPKEVIEKGLAAPS
ncbi:MAG: IS66 family transposase zinc-finger binding domain-containing protein [Candidatus Melainabacteria bacterium]|nr:IS66 family transposase zinc-finger binding domain-containing protein [Candidatus Melainabacteria bacterium]